MSQEGNEENKGSFQDMHLAKIPKLGKGRYAPKAVKQADKREKKTCVENKKATKSQKST